MSDTIERGLDIDGESPVPPRELRDLSRIAVFLLLLGLVALAFVLGHAAMSSGSASGAALWSLALWLLGGFGGFLFGIPKVFQPAPHETPAATGPNVDSAQPTAPRPQAPTRINYHQRINTNLEEISDWITKIIVGLGLVNLKEIPPAIGSLGSMIAPSLGAPADAHAGVATAVVLFFAILGFLFGYLVTRLYVQAALARADVRAQVAAGPEEVRFAAIEERQQTLLGLVEAAGKGASLTLTPSAPDLERGKRELARLSQQYEALNVANGKERIRLKNELANEAYRVALSCGITKEALAQPQQDPLVTAALAVYVNTSPAPSDVQLLLLAGRDVRRLHVRYRVLLAFSTLVSAGFVGGDQRTELLALMKAYRDGADDVLLRRISSLEAQIQTAKAG